MLQSSPAELVNVPASGRSEMRRRRLDLQKPCLQKRRIGDSTGSVNHVQHQE